MEQPIEIHCQAVRARLDSGPDFLLLDCRETDEYYQSSIPGAEHIPMSEMTERSNELEPHREQDIVVYCHLGGRSLKVANWLRDQGFRNVQSMIGGIDRWAVEIQPELQRY